MPNYYKAYIQIAGSNSYGVNDGDGINNYDVYSTPRVCQINRAGQPRPVIMVGKAFVEKVPNVFSHCSPSIKEAVEKLHRVSVLSITAGHPVGKTVVKEAIIDYLPDLTELLEEVLRD